MDVIIFLKAIGNLLFTLLILLALTITSALTILTYAFRRFTPLLLGKREFFTRRK